MLSIFIMYISLFGHNLNMRTIIIFKICGKQFKIHSVFHDVYIIAGSYIVLCLTLLLYTRATANKQGTNTVMYEEDLLYVYPRKYLLLV
jgi:hypothetical protein